MISAYKSKMELSRDSLYIPLKKEAFNSLEITMGAKTTSQDKINVEEIMKEHNIKVIIKDSEMKGDI